MANIPKLETGQALRASLVDRQQYGPRGDLKVARTGEGLVALLDESSHVLAYASDAGTTVDLARLDAIDPTIAGTIVPYVNAFIADTGQKVERYWRTKLYRLVTVSAPTAPGVRTAQKQPKRTLTSFSAPVADPSAGLTPFAAPAPKVEAVEVVEPEPVEVAPTVVTTVATTVTQTVVEPESDEDIPGLRILPKASVKPAGKGWVKVGTVVVRETDLNTLRDAWSLRQSGVPSAVLVTGPSGTAKTALVSAFAASLGVPFLKVDGGSIRTADDWAGAFRQDPNTHVWSHRWSPFARVLRKGEPAIVLIDEVSRTESPQALNALLGLLDWTGSLTVPDSNATLTMPAGVLVIATANIGPEFVGTLPIDGAVRQRFPHGVRMGYPDERIEVALLNDLTGIDPEVGKRLVKMADMQRLNREDPQLYPSGQIISTRVLVDIARRIAVCATEPREAVWSTLRAQFDPGDEKALSVCVDTQFPKPVDEDDATLVEVDDEPETWTCPVCGTISDRSLTVCRKAFCNAPKPSPLITLRP